MKILGIETSCDETAVAVVADGWSVLSNVIETSAAEHAKTGGVVPEVAARDAADKIFPALKQALQAAQTAKEEIDAIAVTAGPGLMGSLLVGVETARTLAYLWKKPLIPVHHITGHICANRLQRPEGIAFPAVVLTVSGGHNELVLWKGEFAFERIGQTIDDAAGEAFDKGARILGLGFPGGPQIARLAEHGNPDAFPFPRPMHASGDLRFSFSGLKTALLYQVRDLGGSENLSEKIRSDLAASYQEAICATLAGKLFQAQQMHPEVRELHLSGGVSANLRLRGLVAQGAKQQGIVFRYPASMAFCTDNAAMIAGAAYWKFNSMKGKGWQWEDVAPTLQREFF